MCKMPAPCEDFTVTRWRGGRDDGRRPTLGAEADRTLRAANTVVG